ncbi:MAG TPA: septal ring lytic transglycosylase RlpA family protein [Solirubrobacteraceae bacterium]|nr:septal ring lytic transglycosylase RlpA family protein [Solirubrobacteraceae bacterium]
MRVQLAPLALIALVALLLVVPTGTAAASVVSGAIATSGGITAGQLDGPVGPAGVFGSPARARMSFRRLHAVLNVLDGHATSVAGRLLPAHGGHLVELQRRWHRGWLTLAHTFTGHSGRFSLSYTPHGLHERRLRVLFPGDGGAGAAVRRLGTLGVFRLAGASWYGGGGSLACGGWLTSSTLGVANKTLPCGTLVTLRFGARSIRVPVVDRGPYVAGRDFDLTEATKRALGFEGVGQVWSSR